MHLNGANGPQTFGLFFFKLFSLSSHYFHTLSQNQAGDSCKLMKLVLKNTNMKEGNWIEVTSKNCLD